MALTVDDDAGEMASSRCDMTATRLPDGRWTVSGRPGTTYDRNQAITALTIAEALADGYPSDHLLVQALEAELQGVERD